MDEEPPLVLASAGRHGVRDSSALHAWAFAMDVFAVGDGMVMYVGPDESGDLLEIGVVDWHGVLAIVHAMPAREKFLR